MISLFSNARACSFCAKKKSSAAEPAISRNLQISTRTFLKYSTTLPNISRNLRQPSRTFLKSSSNLTGLFPEKPALVYGAPAGYGSFSGALFAIIPTSPVEHSLKSSATISIFPGKDQLPTRTVLKIFNNSSGDKVQQYNCRCSQSTIPLFSCVGDSRKRP